MPTPPLSLDQVRSLARLLHEADLSEIEVEAVAPPDFAVIPTSEATDVTPAPRVRLQLRRGTEPTVVRRAASTPTATRSASAPSISAGDEPASTGAEASGVWDILSPTVGVFLAPRPPLQVGDEVKAGQKAGAVESLKIPTDIFFQHAGRITAILAEDNRGVEYAQPLYQVQGDK